MTSVIFKNVRLLNFEDSEGMTSPQDVMVSDGKIVKIGKDLPTVNVSKVMNGKNNLLMPGLINGHFHSPVNHMKGMLPSLPLEIFMLFESPELEVLRPTPREAYLRTMLGCIEMLKNGVTSVQDDCFFVPEPDQSIIDAVIQAYIDSGMRVRFALDQPEVSELKKLPFLADIVSDDLKKELSKPSKVSSKQLLEYYQYLIDNWHGFDDGRIKAAVSCSAPQRVSKDYFLSLDNLSKKYDLPFYAHMLETRLQRVFGEVCLDGRSLVQYTEEIGMLSERMNIIHAVWVNNVDLDIIAEYGACVAHNPISNLRLGSGIMPLRQMLDRNIPVCLGVDEAIADDSVNMWSVMKSAATIHNLSDWDYSKWPSASEVLLAATKNGGLAMREPKLGELEVGAPADLILIDTNSLPFTPLNNLHRQLVYCELGQSVRLTMVAGKIVVSEKQMSTVNEVDILEETREVFERQRKNLAQAFTKMDEILPYYKKMYDMAGDYQLNMRRRLN